MPVGPTSSCPQTSSRVRGRMRSARGAASCSALLRLGFLIGGSLEDSGLVSSTSGRFDEVALDSFCAVGSGAWGDDVCLSGLGDGPAVVSDGLAAAGWKKEETAGDFCGAMVGSTEAPCDEEESRWDWHSESMWRLMLTSLTARPHIGQSTISTLRV